MIKNLNEKIDYINNAFNGTKKPVLKEFLIAGNINAAIFFVDEITNSDAINKDILRPLMKAEIQQNQDVMNIIKSSIVPFGDMESFDDINLVTGFLLDGNAVLFVDGQAEMISFSVKKWGSRGIEEPPTSTVIYGPREGFNEDMKTNISLIRRRVKSPDLTIDMINVGKYSATKVEVVYINTVADKNIVNTIKKRISKVNIDGILDSTYLEAFLEDNRRTVFTQVGKTEKPDIAVGKMLEGRVCVIVDGCPSVLTLPHLFMENFQDSGDYYGLNERKSYLRILRLVSYLFAVLHSRVICFYALFH